MRIQCIEKIGPPIDISEIEVGHRITVNYRGKLKSPEELNATYIQVGK